MPAEVALCESLNLSEADYWHFVELTERYTAERPAGYELVPDVRNDIVTILINLVIGIALSAISALLAPKPQEPKTPPSKRTADVKGPSRFAPQTAFDSVQELAALGEIIPLVFTRKGVRVASSLLWSQMLSLGTGQQLRLMAMFSSGQLEARPEFAGYAIGDSLLENYVHAKIALYFKTNGGRIAEGGADRYAEGTAESVTHSDAFSVIWDKEAAIRPYFSGTRTPGTQTQFGVYRPMPNGTRYRVDYELILKPKDADSDLKDDINIKQNKVYREEFARWCAVTEASSTAVTYEIGNGKEPKGRFKPWGIEDVNSFTESERYGVDDALAIGDSYLIGSALVTGVNVPVTPWLVDTTKTVTFRVLEAGTVDVRTSAGEDPVHANLLPMCVALGTVSNNRECTCTEIGIKSTVYKQITGFPNVNSIPSKDTLQKYENNNGSFQLGTVTKYVYRLSFFELQVRPLGSTAAWRTINDGTVFCVRGNTPQAQYNFIRISHPFGQYEFRLRPYSGNLALRLHKGARVLQLTSGTLMKYTAGEFMVSFAGAVLNLSEAVTSNKEWIKGEPPPDPTGTVVALSSYSIGSVPADIWVVNANRYSGEDFVYRQSSNPANKYNFHWGGDLIGQVSALTDFLLYNGYRFKIGALEDQAQLPNNAGTATWYRIIREAKAPAPATSDTTVAVSGGSGTGLTLRVLVYSVGNAQWSITAGGTGYTNGEQITVPGAGVAVNLVTDAADLLDNNLNPHDAIADINLYASERNSHDDGPEHEIAYVNEQVEQAAPQYDDLAYAGLRINSTKEWTNFSGLSAYIKLGCMVDRLTTSGRSATNLLPEIAVALLTDPLLGAGNIISKSQVDLTRMTIAARFCEANGFTWDGVIDAKQNIRQWIYEQAGYCMLDFTILGGQFSLVPSVPYSGDFKVAPTAKPEIKALFTDGNIKDLRVTFLSPEERKLFKAVLSWRQEKDNGFPQTRVLTVRLSNSEGGSDADPEEQFDMSGFCTTQAHPLQFAKYALRTRQKVDHAVQFKTTPQAAMGLAPGEYFRLVSEVTHTSRFNNGTIGPDGTITCVGDLPGSASILYWAPGTIGVSETTLSSSGGKTTQTALWGTVFTIANTTTVNRVYKVETLSYADDGLVDVAASYAPLTSVGALAVLDWPEAAFVVEVG